MRNTIRIAALLAVVAASAAAGSAAQDVASEAPPRRDRASRPVPLPPDWPRAGGFGPLERSLSEGLAVEGLLGSAGEVGSVGAARRDLTDDDVAAAIEVARRISPEWGEALAARAEGDPAQLRQAMRGGARRLLALAALRERVPEVFEAKIIEIRAQGATTQAADALARARAGTDEAAIAAAERTLEEAISRQVEAALAVRRAELVALDRRVAEMKARLAEDESRQAELAAELVADLAARAEAPRARRGRDEATPEPTPKPGPR